jgi:hypothetical protein
MYTKLKIAPTNLSYACAREPQFILVGIAKFGSGGNFPRGWIIHPGAPEYPAHANLALKSGSELRQTTQVFVIIWIFWPVVLVVMEFHEANGISE